MGVYAATVAGLGVLVRRSRRDLPHGYSAADFALVSVATHKLSRLLAKDAVTSPLRMPFTRFEGPRVRRSWPMRSAASGSARRWVSW